MRVDDRIPDPAAHEERILAHMKRIAAMGLDGPSYSETARHRPRPASAPAVVSPKAQARRDKRAQRQAFQLRDADIVRANRLARAKNGLSAKRAKSMERQYRMLDMYEAGQRVADIAAALGMNHSTVVYGLRQARARKAAGIVAEVRQPEPVPVLPGRPMCDDGE